MQSYLIDLALPKDRYVDTPGLAQLLKVWMPCEAVIAEKQTSVSIVESRLCVWLDSTMSEQGLPPSEIRNRSRFDVTI